VLEVLYRHTKFGGDLISSAAGAVKNVEFFVCPSRFLCHACGVTLLNVGVCAPDFTMTTLKYRNDFDPLDRGRFVVVHPCSTFSDCRQLSTSLNAEVQKKRQKLGFFATRWR